MPVEPEFLCRGKPSLVGPQRCGCESQNLLRVNIKQSPEKNSLNSYTERENYKERKPMRENSWEKTSLWMKSIKKYSNIFHLSLQDSFPIWGGELWGEYEGTSQKIAGLRGDSGELFCLPFSAFSHSSVFSERLQMFREGYWTDQVWDHCYFKRPDNFSHAANSSDFRLELSSTFRSVLNFPFSFKNIEATRTLTNDLEER